MGRVRARKHRLRDDHVTLAHGAGGKASAALVENVFWEIFGGDVLPDGGDSAVLPLAGILGEGAGADAAGSLAMSTDSYVVNPIEFPGGDIGELAVNGTVNDLAVAGAVPKAITAAFVLEEGLPIDVLRRIVESMARAAEAAGVAIVAGDTKVVPRGACDKLYITTAGVGVVPTGRRTGYGEIAEGDRIIVSGPIADHGMAVMMARGDLAIEAPIQSDTRAVNGLVEALFAAVPDVRFLRDATRGGLATVMNELARGSGKGIALDDGAIAVRNMTRAACDMLGIDPLYVANEGTFTAVVPEGSAEAAVAALHDAGAPEARVIGRVVAEPAASVVLVTGFGGTRMVDMLVGDPLPRIC
ncbi:hypothetical protein WU86_04985 [Corynebacterium xerosis]|nr:hypothetical protein WU86_04985 [Corynebacterium xerosis]